MLCAIRDVSVSIFICDSNRTNVGLTSHIRILDQMNATTCCLCAESFGPAFASFHPFNKFTARWIDIMKMGFERQPAACACAWLGDSTMWIGFLPSPWLHNTEAEESLFCLTHGSACAPPKPFSAMARAKLLCWECLSSHVAKLSGLVNGVHCMLAFCVCGSREALMGARGFPLQVQLGAAPVVVITDAEVGRSGPSLSFLSLPSEGV